MVKIPGGKGGYTKFYIHLDASTGLYCFVGGSGNAAEGKETAGGWNGGGSVIKCGEGLHAGSGGGMTHVSYTNNPASDSNGESVLYWNPDGTIGVAGGGGGSGRSYHRIEDKAFGGYGGGEVAGNGIYSHTLNYKQKHEPLGATQTTGYKQGIGEPNYNSGGGGGGWYGGYSTGHTKSTQGGACWAGGGGGSGYICEAGKQTKYTHLNECLAGNNPSIPTQPTATISIDGDNGGYIRINLYERD